MPETDRTGGVDDPGSAPPVYQWRRDLFVNWLAHIANVRQTPKWASEGRRYIQAVHLANVDFDAIVTTDSSRCPNCQLWQMQHPELQVSE